MPDITMCMNPKCDKKDSCYRFKAVPNRLQSYSDFTDDCKNNNYRNYWEIWDKIKPVPMMHE